MVRHPPDTQERIDRARGHYESRRNRRRKQRWDEVVGDWVKR